MRPSLFETQEEFEGRTLGPPEPGLSPIHRPKAKSEPTHHHGGSNHLDLDVGAFLGSCREHRQHCTG